MKKNVVQDIIPPKKSIRNVEMPSRVVNIKQEKTAPKEDFVLSPGSKKESPKDVTPIRSASVESGKVPINLTPTPPSSINKEPPPYSPSYKYEYPNNKKRSRKGLYITLSLLILAGVFGVSAMFQSAEIRYTPKNETKVLSSSFRATKDATGNNLGFQVVTISKSIEKTLDASVTTTQQEVNKKAQGKIVIYNNHSTVPQKLVATTRFETPEKLIFRLISGVTVPGQQVKDGKTVAGSVEVTVEGDKPGSSYNIGLKDFTIPGLKGDPKYTTIYARSKTEMTGGFTGVLKTVSKEILDNADKELKTTLEESLSKDISSQIPADFVLYNNSLVFDLEGVTQANNSNGQVVLRKKGSAEAVIFDKGSLTRAISGKILSPMEGSIKITNLQDLNLEWALPKPVDLDATSTINFNLKGEPRIVWVFDENKLKTDLLGLSKQNAKTIIATYGTIKEAWVLTRPFWNQKIPSDPEKVVLINSLETPE